MLTSAANAISDYKLQEISKNGSLREIDNLNENDTYGLTGKGIYEAFIHAYNDDTEQKLIKKLVEIFSQNKSDKEKKEQVFTEVLNKLRPNYNDTQMYIMEHVFKFGGDCVQILRESHNFDGVDRALEYFIEQRNFHKVEMTARIGYKSPYPRPSIDILKKAAQTDYEITKCLLDEFAFNREELIQVSKKRMTERTRNLIKSRIQKRNIRPQKFNKGFLGLQFRDPRKKKDIVDKGLDLLDKLFFNV